MKVAPFGQRLDSKLLIEHYSGSPTFQPGAPGAPGAPAGQGLGTASVPIDSGPYPLVFDSDWQDVAEAALT